MVIRASSFVLSTLASLPSIALSQEHGFKRVAFQTRIGREIPDSLVFSMAGEEIRLTERKGRKLVLAFVRDGQQLSRSLLADLQEERGRLERDGIDLVAVASAESSRHSWQVLLEEGGIKFLLAFDKYDRLLHALDLKALPATLVIDENVKVASVIFLHRANFKRALWREIRLAGVTRGEEAGLGASEIENRQKAIRDLIELGRTGTARAVTAEVMGLRTRWGRHLAVRMVSGKVLLESGQPAAALVDFQVAQELEPASLLVKLWLGLAQARSGNSQLAVKRLGDVAPFVPEGWRAYGELGSIAHKNGNPEEALGFFQECLAPGSMDIWTTGGAWVGTRAPILDVRGVLKKASRPAVRLTSSKPTVVLFWMTGNGPSRNALAQLRRWEARFGEERVAIVAVNVDKRRFSATDRDEASRALAAASITLPCWLDRDLESFARFDISAVPTTVLIDHGGVVVRRVAGTDFSALHADLETLTSERTSERTSESSKEKETSQVFSSTADRHLGMARQLARLGRLTPALESARQALRMAPQSAAATAFVAQVLLASGRVEEAAKLLYEATEKGLATSELLAIRGDCLLARGAREEARESYLRAIELGSLGPAHHGFGRVLVATGKPREAVPEFRRAVQLNPHDENALISLAQALRSLGNKQEAAQAYEEALRRRWSRQSVLARVH